MIGVLGYGTIIALGLGAALNLWTTHGFRQGILRTKGDGATAFYWVTSIPGLLAALVTVVGIVVMIILVAGTATVAGEEAKRSALRSDIQQGVRDAMRDDVG